MNNPKTYLTVFALCCLVLWGLLKLSPSQKDNTFQAQVVSQTTTQSLDGHRRYLQIETPDEELHLIQSDPLIDCPENSTATIAIESHLFSNRTSFKFVRCIPPTIK
jgi:hypothetical protein